MKPFIYEKVLKELRRTPFNVRSNIIDIGSIAATKECSRNALMEHTQPQESMNTRTSKKGLLPFNLGYTPDTSSMRSTQTQKQDSGSHLHPLDTLKVVRS